MKVLHRFEVHTPENRDICKQCGKSKIWFLFGAEGRVFAFGVNDLCLCTDKEEK